MTFALILILFIAVFHREQFTLLVPMHPSTIFHITSTFQKNEETRIKKPQKLCKPSLLINKDCLTKSAKP